jgi:hypothetical protein
MANLELENAMLIFKGWLENSMPLLVESSSPGVAVRSTFSVLEITGSGVLLKAINGDSQLIIELDDPETRLAYFEPREFAGREEYKEQFTLIPEADKCKSSIGASFAFRVTGPNVPDLLVQAGKIVFVALKD